MEIGHGPVQNATHAATGWGLLAIVLWSTTIACSRSMAEQLGAFTSAATVYLAAGLIGCAGPGPAGKACPRITTSQPAVLVRLRRTDGGLYRPAVCSRGPGTDSS